MQITTLTPHVGKLKGEELERCDGPWFIRYYDPTTNQTHETYAPTLGVLWQRMCFLVTHGMTRH